jgi:hypothetical protein
MRQEIDARVQSGLQRAGWTIRREKAATGAAPSLRPDHARPRAAIDEVYRVERGEDAARNADKRRREAGKRDELTVIVGADIEDAPARAANADVLRNLHRASAARVQKVPRRKLRGCRINELHHPSGDGPDEGQAMCRGIRCARRG